MGMGSAVLLLHLLGWGTLMLFVVPAHHQLGTSGVFGLGIGLTAYTLGMRHAFDADHIAAIDNTARRLTEDGRAGSPRPLSVGFWFSLGHSSVVLLLVALLVLGVRTLAGQLGDESSLLRRVTATIGPAVSGTFLLLIGTLNLVALVSIVRLARETRRGRHDETALESWLSRRGLVSRLVDPLARAVRRPWQLYPVGLLFGLGFDTATEIGLLVLAGGTAVLSLPWYATITLPVLFAAGMSLLDAADGVLVSFVYGWAAARPARRISFDLTVTALSVVVALLVGGVELVPVLVDGAGITSGPLVALADLDLRAAGLAVVAFFVVLWLVGRMSRRRGRVSRRWSTDP